MLPIQHGENKTAKQSKAVRLVSADLFLHDFFLTTAIVWHGEGILEV